MYPEPIAGPSILAPGYVVILMDDYAAGSRAAEWAIDEVRCGRTYTNRLKVETTSRFVGPLQVIGLCGVILGDTYRYPLYASFPTESDTGSFAMRIRAEQATGPSAPSAGDVVQWAVTIDYAPFDVAYQLGNSRLPGGIVDPTERASEVYWDAAKYDRSKPEDEDSPPKPYLNTVGDPLIDTPQVEESRPVLKFVRCEPVYDDLYASQWKDTVNEDEFLGYAPNTVKCRGIKGERFFDPDWGHYFKVTYEFEFRVDDDGNGFDQRILNAGYRYKKGGSGNPVNILDANQQPTHDAKPLTEDGDLVAPGDDPYFLTFIEFPSMSFADLNIPDDILNIA